MLIRCVTTAAIAAPTEINIITFKSIPDDGSTANASTKHAAKCFPSNLAAGRYDGIDSYVTGTGQNRRQRHGQRWNGQWKQQGYD